MKKIIAVLALGFIFAYGGIFDSIGSFFSSQKSNNKSQTANDTATQAVKNLTGQTTEKETDSLLNQITSATNLSPKQATGTVGVLMQYAKSNMTNSEYSKVIKDVPVLKNFQTSATSSMLSSLTNSAMSSSMVEASLKTLGVDPSVVKIIIPILVDYASKYGSQISSSILSKSLSGLMS